MAWYDKFFNRKTPLSNPVLPTGLELVKQFTTDDEPKIVDYPKGQYQAFWEIFLGEVPGGVTAEVRIYGYEGGGVLYTERFTGPYVAAIKPKVNALIRAKMNEYKR